MKDKLWYLNLLCDIIRLGLSELSQLCHEILGLIFIKRSVDERGDLAAGLTIATSECQEILLNK